MLYADYHHLSIFGSERVLELMRAENVWGREGAGSGAVRLRNSGANFGADRLQITLRGLDRVNGFHTADDGDVVERIVALAAHAVKEGKGGGKTQG